MVWVFVFGGIALAGLVMLVCYAVWLAHKTSDLFSELGMLSNRAGQLMGLAAQISMPRLAPDDSPYDRDLAVSSEVSE